MSDDVDRSRTDADRLRAVAETLRSLGMRVTGFRVGDIQVQLGAPWGADAPPSAMVSTAAAKEDPEDRLNRLRQVAKQSLGFVPPDEQLEKLAPALLGPGR